MDFELNENQKLIQDTARRFAQEKIEPIASEIDKTGEFPHEIIKEMAELGLMGMIIPEEYGGAGLDFTSLAIAVEEISKASGSVGVIMAVNNSLCAYPILAFGNEQQKKKYLPLLATGKALGAFALTEPNVGSDPAHLEST
ncbi:MAG: acyl-CoA dehydrogenase family protein, partial [candidate division WOR-3 bacterium]